MIASMPHLHSSQRPLLIKACKQQLTCQTMLDMMHGIVNVEVISPVALGMFSKHLLSTFTGSAVI